MSESDWSHGDARCMSRYTTSLPVLPQRMRNSPRSLTHTYNTSIACRFPSISDYLIFTEERARLRGIQPIHPSWHHRPIALALNLTFPIPTDKPSIITATTILLSQPHLSENTFSLSAWSNCCISRNTTSSRHTKPLPTRHHLRHSSAPASGSAEHGGLHRDCEPLSASSHQLLLHLTLHLATSNRFAHHGGGYHYGAAGRGCKQSHAKSSSVEGELRLSSSLKDCT
jgi:hypothetical protein